MSGRFCSTFESGGQYSTQIVITGQNVMVPIDGVDEDCSNGVTNDKKCSTAKVIITVVLPDDYVARN